MKISIFNSSPRKEKGNTHRIVMEFLTGAHEQGATSSYTMLADKNIKPCNGCFNCWITTPGKCTTCDDMSSLLEEIKSTDILVFATPLYIDNVTGIMKNFMDRLIPLIDPHFEKDENNEYRHTKRLSKIPLIGIISNCGFPEQSHFQVLRLLVKRFARNMQSSVAFEIYRGSGELLGSDNLILKPFLWNYKRLLKKAGKEVALNSCISPETIQNLEKPIIPYDQYIKGANKYWDKKISFLEN